MFTTKHILAAGRLMTAMKGVKDKETLVDASKRISEELSNVPNLNLVKAAIEVCITRQRNTRLENKLCQEEKIEFLENILEMDLCREVDWCYVHSVLTNNIPNRRQRRAAQRQQRKQK